MTRGSGARQRGFTLIEIMVVVVIIGLLAAVVTQTLMGNVDKAKVEKAKQDIHVLEQALDIYKLDNQNYPTTEQGLQALVTKPPDPNLTNYNDQGYVKRLSKDPWGNPYHYENPGTHGGAYDLYSLGADNQPGGEKYNADIGNWNLE
ncbi:MAG TPA: type II secretion system major pseudopilin GspG [Steroidobacteraceae bacterium]|nr:type II secretion system major pseudopilin GspG [Steroidobacteraceae bacterium]